MEDSICSVQYTTGDAQTWHSSAPFQYSYVVRHDIEEKGFLPPRKEIAPCQITYLRLMGRVFDAQYFPGTRDNVVELRVAVTIAAHSAVIEIYRSCK